MPRFLWKACTKREREEKKNSSSRRGQTRSFSLSCFHATFSFSNETITANPLRLNAEMIFQQEDSRSKLERTTPWNLSNHQSINQSINLSINQSLDQSIKQAINQSIDQSLFETHLDVKSTAAMRLGVSSAAADILYAVLGIKMGWQCRTAAPLDWVSGGMSPSALIDAASFFVCKRFVFRFFFSAKKFCNAAGDSPPYTDACILMGGAANNAVSADTLHESGDILI